MIALLIDVGNTRIKWRMARVDGAADDACPRWVSTAQAIRTIDVDDLEAALRATAEVPADAVELAHVANVASEATGNAVRDAVSAIWPTSAVQFVRSSPASCGLVNAYRDPLQLGVDRWLAAIAAHATCPDRSVLVCTFGTATTIDLVEHHCFVGGLILPGVDAMHQVLTTSTARLAGGAGQVVDFGDRTEDAIASGVMAAQLGAVEHTLRKARDRLAAQGDALPPTCIVAGGAADRVTPLLDRLDTPYRVIHDLVLRGLALSARDASTVSRPVP